jgi:nucleotide-binding universal stress UspA family protein
MYQRILVPLDGSALAEQVLQHVEPLAEKFGASIVLLQATQLLSSAQVAAAPPFDPTLVHEEERKTATTYLGEVQSRLQAKGYTVESRQPEGNPAEEIVHHARNVGADLIAMATHGRTGLARVFLGSVAEEVVRKSFCPVLLVRVSGDS